MPKILIVDDEDSIRETFTEFLSSDGHEVLSVDNASAAIELLRDHDFDVIVTDIILPAMSGVELLTRIREFNSTVQVIMITGEPTYETAAQAIKHKAFDYIAKPVSGRTLCRVVERAAEVKALISEKQRLQDENERYQSDLEQLVRLRTAELETANRQLLDEIGIRSGVQAELQHINTRLERIIDDIIHTMSLTLEKRDPYTAGHQVRVAELARKIADELGFPADRVKSTFLAGMLHDIGKISVPAEILAKPLRLSVEEYALVKKHCETGYEILKSFDFPWNIAEITVQHHERFDGSGYPEGLAGENIVLEARILAVADTVEAMAHHRPYRAALGLEAALEEIGAVRKARYDPDVVEACLRVFREGRFAFTNGGI